MICSYSVGEYCSSREKFKMYFILKLNKLFLKKGGQGVGGKGQKQIPACSQQQLAWK